MEMWALATFILVAGLVDDLRSRKVHNSLIISLFAVVAVGTLYFRGPLGSLPGVGALILSLVATIPLFAARIWGGGDVKLFAVFALAVDPATMFWTLLYSFFWGALFGVTHAALRKQLMSVVKNTYRIATRQKVVAPQLQKIPYSFALLLGWFTQLTLLRIGGHL